MPISFKNLVNRWLRQRHFFAGVFIPFFFVCIMVNGGFRNLTILLYEGRTTATFTELKHSGSRVYDHYRYEVNGRTYTGAGGPDHQPFTPPFKVGDTFEVRYSKMAPFFSTAGEPFTIFGQFLVACLFVLFVDYLSVRNRSKSSLSGVGQRKALP